MKVCILNTGGSHAIYRTIALSEFCEIEAFIQIGKLNHHHKALKNAGIKVISLNYKGFTEIKIARFIKTQTNADYYICHFAYGMHIDACIYAKLKNIAVVAMGSDILSNEYSKLEQLRKKFVLRRVTYISCKSEEIFSILKDWKIKSEISINYWGVNKDQFFNMSEIDAKNLLKLETGKNIFLSSRTIGRLYNIDLIAKAFVEINKKIDNALFIFVGWIGDPNYLAEIEKYFQKQGLINYKFVDDVDKKLLNLYYNASKIVYSFAYREGFPNTFFEVFACKVNLICGEIETLVNFSKKKQSDFNMCNFDEKSITAKTLEILSNPDYSSQVIEKNYKIFQDYGNLNNNAKNFYDELLRTSSSERVKFLSIITLLIYDLLQIFGRKIQKIFYT